jgi:glycosyltransferase involved in cell wall biosynthesis
MSIPAPISACIIVKNEPLLEKCILSIREHVKEIVIIDTGSTDGTTIEIAKKYADIFESYSACNNSETGLIENFAQARQRSYDLGNQPWTLWLDADDIIEGAENLAKIIESHVDLKEDDAVGVMFPYEYSYNEAGQCTCKHYRERLVFNKDKFHWVNPVHEVLIPKDGIRYTLNTIETVVYKHQRQYGTKVHEPGRNLRILRNYFEKVGDSDARQMYYLGLECFNSGLIDEAIQHLSKYVDISGWDDERAMACLKLIDIFLMKADYESGLKWGFKTIALKETWGEGYFAIGKMFYFMAQAGGPNEMRHWERCVNFIKMGLNLPATKTLLFINPLDRECDIHRYFNMALSKIGDVNGAIESVNIALKSKPNDDGLLLNKKIYEEYIATQQAVHFINVIKDLGKIDNANADLIISIINKRTNQVECNAETKSWNIPTDLDLTAPPAELSDEQLQAVVVMMWKQLMLYDDAKSAISFLENTPLNIRNSFITGKMLGLTKEFLYQDQSAATVVNSNSLDIVFFIGNGVEAWTPASFQKTGLGGSETMAIEMSKRLAALGHKVRVYNSCGGMEGIYDGVQYYQTEKFHDLECDVLIISRRADMLGDQFNIKAKLKLLWIHDVCALAATNELLLKADRILVLSEWHKQNIMKVHNVHSDHIVVTRNGIDLSLFDKNIKRNKYKCINASSPDRSWPILLDNIWPRIREAVPNAELHLYYGFKNWEYAAQYDKGQADLILYLKNKIKEMAALGVVYHDRINQDKLADEFLSASVMLHPTWFTETFGITFASAQAAGIKIISSSIAALNEVVGDRGILIDGVWTDKEYQDKFVQAAISALNED